MDKNPSNIKERVLHFAKIKGIAKEKMCMEIGKTYSNFKSNAKNTPLNSKTIENLFSIYPDINLEWLIAGVGEPMKSDSYLLLLDRLAELSQEVTYYKGIIKELEEQGIKIPVKKEYALPESPSLRVAEEKPQLLSKKKREQKD